MHDHGNEEHRVMMLRRKGDLERSKVEGGRGEMVGSRRLWRGVGGNSAGESDYIH